MVANCLGVCRYCCVRILVQEGGNGDGGGACHGDRLAAVALIRVGMQLASADFDPWATTHSEMFRVAAERGAENPPRSAALISHGVTAGSERYADKPPHQREQLARLGSPQLTRHEALPRRSARRHERVQAVNIFEDIARSASAYDVGSGRAMGAKYFRGGQLGHIAGYADLGSDNHYGVIGERRAKQVVTTGYNDADSDGSRSRAAQIKLRMEEHPLCEAAVVYIGAYSEARLTQLIGQASSDLRVHHREAWMSTNTQQPGFGATTAVDSGRGDSAKMRWCTVRMTDGLCVCVYWVEPGVPRFKSWTKPAVAGGSGDKVSGSTPAEDDDSLTDLAIMGGGKPEGSDTESDWGGSASDAAGSSSSSHLSAVDVQNA